MGGDDRNHCPFSGLTDFVGKLKRLIMSKHL